VLGGNVVSQWWAPDAGKLGGRPSFGRPFVSGRQEVIEFSVWVVRTCGSRRVVGTGRRGGVRFFVFGPGAAACGGSAKCANSAWPPLRTFDEARQIVIRALVDARAWTPPHLKGHSDDLVGGRSKEFSAGSLHMARGKWSGLGSCTRGPRACSNRRARTIPDVRILPQASNPASRRLTDWFASLRHLSLRV